MSTRRSLSSRLLTSVIRPDRRLSASKYFPSKEMQAWPPLAVEGKFASQHGPLRHFFAKGNLKIRCA
ncbi:unnamed protein product [Prunus armeniaca]